VVAGRSCAAALARSGRIQFDELEEFVRGDLSYMRGDLSGGMDVARGDISDSQLVALWLAIDADMSGFLDARDFTRVLRMVG